MFEINMILQFLALVKHLTTLWRKMREQHFFSIYLYIKHYISYYTSHIAKLSFNFNLVESQDGFILNSPTPPTQPSTPEKVVTLGKYKLQFHFQQYLGYN